MAEYIEVYPFILLVFQSANMDKLICLSTKGMFYRKKFQPYCTQNGRSECNRVKR